LNSTDFSARGGLPADLLRQLYERGAALDAAQSWPGKQFDLLAGSGVLGWVIPPEFGGSEVTQAALLEGYICLAAACLTTAFILTQRNGACQRIVASSNEALRRGVLPPLARGEQFATVGISHLTTSRQHFRQPPVKVEPVRGGFRFQGEVPWVTGAAHAQYIVTGGVLADGKQVLAAIPTNLTGVRIGPPARLLALGASQTSSVHLDQVDVAEQWLIAGPTEQVMKLGGGGAGGLATSALAIGRSFAAIGALQVEADRRPELQEILSSLRTECEALQAEVLRAADDSSARAPAQAIDALRGRANSLVLRATQSLLAASKGAGFVSGHFAERAVREAMFFLVWSCPQPVVRAALREFAGVSDCSV
jgi:alkylation response protein AidB-like acyl-CoA dehydrogenase